MKTTIDMARKSGFTDGELAFMGDNFRRFADLVRADEREVCAQVVEEYPHWLGMTAKAEIANAIRARGNP
jgi:hypothetical protein